MTAFDYGRPLATATRLIAKFGQPATIRRKGAATGPPYAPTYGPDTLHTCTAVMGHYSAREREGTSIAATDVKVTASALDISPTAADILVIGGVDYEIVEAMPLRPGGEVLLWKIQARG